MYMYIENIRGDYAYNPNPSKTCRCLELGRLEGYMHVHVHELYLSHVVGDVQIHVDADDELDQVLSQVGVLMDDGKVQRAI